jgi:hypothetical protein
MDGNTLIRRRAGLIEAEVDGELIGLHIDNGTCYGFNETATRVWGLIDEPHTISEICQALASEFDVPPDRCRGEVSALLRDLHADGLIALE